MIDPAEIPLRDIHLPAPVSWWPPAPGWIALAVVIAGALIGSIAWFMWHRRHRVRRAALAELTAIELAYREHRDTHRLARDLSRLARRTALAIDNAPLAAAVTGPAWADKLDQLSKTGVADLKIKAALCVAPYRPDEALDGDALLRAFRPWLMDLRAPQATGK